jgi:NAD(P)-dependent dehydrogenase (short-subunit alcohol dehydrogenase family)
VNLFGTDRTSTRRPLGQQVVVVTGASSGIGCETAKQFAERGATVVLAARNEEALAATVDEIEVLGGTAVAVPTDVGDWPQVGALAETAVERFGRIDTWVNAAVVSTFGTLAETPVEDIDRVLQTGLRGQFYGVKAALPVMREQGGGTIIGISSVFGVRSVPLQVAYCAAKHGTTALYEGLRVEQQVARSGVSVTTVFPPAVNTPFYDVARSYTGTRPPIVPPVYQPSAVAEAVLRAAEHPVRHVYIGAAAPAAAALQRISPRALDVVLRRALEWFQCRGGPPANAGQSNLHTPMPGPGAIGRARVALPRSRYTRTVGYHPGKATTAAAAAWRCCRLAVDAPITESNAHDPDRTRRRHRRTTGAGLPRARDVGRAAPVVDHHR